MVVKYNYSVRMEIVCLFFVWWFGVHAPFSCSSVCCVFGDELESCSCHLSFESQIARIASKRSCRGIILFATSTLITPIEEVNKSNENFQRRCPCNACTMARLAWKYSNQEWMYSHVGVWSHDLTINYSIYSTETAPSALAGLS